MLDERISIAPVGLIKLFHLQYLLIKSNFLAFLYNCNSNKCYVISYISCSDDGVDRSSLSILYERTYEKNCSIFRNVRDKLFCLIKHTLTVSD